MSWTEYLRKHKHTNKSEDDIYIDYYNKYLCNEDFENEILKETYDIAKENIENVFFELSGIKKEFKNINNVDTFNTY